ncbi:MAG: dolichyl-phosphate-mannose-protein mannosyltransferase family protein, partial [Pedosphaera sp.]|nr:dolichyl-phosphate-mannose-protein mannosyltransferase family protein [Pedosphaera sp.]
HPIFFVGMIWAAIAFWRSEKNRPLLLYLFSMGAPIFIFYFLFSIRSRVLPNWIAPAIVPLFALMVVYFDQRWRDGQRWVKSLLIVSLVLGGIATLFMQAPGIVPAITGRPLPPRSDPLRRVTKWSEMARLAGEERTKLLAEGKPVFFICDHYGTTSLLTFYLPEAKQGVPDHPLVYAWPLAAPENQFYFWPGYKNRKGENALFVRQGTEPQAAPEFLGKDFESVTDLGMRDVYYHGQVYRRIQIFACRNLR